MYVCMCVCVYIYIYAIREACGSPGKESACNEGDLVLIPGLGRSPGEGQGFPLHILAWRIPWTVQSMRSQRVRQD